jgi:hypothetical protein
MVDNGDRLAEEFANPAACRTTYRKADGSDGSGRYTGGWCCVSEHVSRF